MILKSAARHNAGPSPGQLGAVSYCALTHISRATGMVAQTFRIDHANGLYRRQLVAGQERLPRSRSLFSMAPTNSRERIMPQVPTTPLGRITGSVATDDGHHILIQTEQQSGNEQVFSLEDDQSIVLVQALAEGHMQCRNRRGVPLEARDTYPVSSWGISLDLQSRRVVLSLTVGPNARFDFALSEAMPRQMLRTLQEVLRHTTPPTPNAPPN